MEVHCNSLFSSLSYLWDGVAVDPGDALDCWQGVQVVLLTHAHFDHIYGLNELLRRCPQAVVYTNEAGQAMLADARKNMSAYHESPFVLEWPERVRVVADGEAVPLPDGSSAVAVFTPGHNPSCITWVAGDLLFTGDAYIPGIRVVTKLPGGDRGLAAESLSRILTLAAGRRVLGGHAI